MFPDVAERLALAHLAKGDQMSALITGGGCWLVLFSQPSTCASFCWIGQPCCSTAMQSITKPLVGFILRASLPLLPTPLALGATLCAAAHPPVVRPACCAPMRLLTQLPTPPTLAQASGTCATATSLAGAGRTSSTASSWRGWDGQRRHVMW